MLVAINWIEQIVVMVKSIIEEPKNYNNTFKVIKQLRPIAFNLDENCEFLYNDETEEGLEIQALATKVLEISKWLDAYGEIVEEEEIKKAIKDLERLIAFYIKIEEVEIERARLELEYLYSLEQSESSNEADIEGAFVNKLLSQIESGEISWLEANEWLDLLVNDVELMKDYLAQL